MLQAALCSIGEKPRRLSVFSGRMVAIKVGYLAVWKGMSIAVGRIANWLREWPMIRYVTVLTI